MVYLQFFLRLLTFLRIAVLSVLIFFLIQGVLVIPVPYLKFWLYAALIFSLIHIAVDTIGHYFFRFARFTYTAFLIAVWVLFLHSTRIINFLSDNSYETQTLFSAVTLSLVGIYIYQDLRRSFAVFAGIKLDSRVTIVFSFLLVILLGTGLLVLPISSFAPGVAVAPINAFFTAVSAVCVTGLSVVDIAASYSRFGQIIILILIQIGSLGLVTITAVFINLLGQSLSMSGQLSAKDSFSSRYGDNNLQQFLRFVLLFTVVVEAIIAGILFICFSKDFLGQVPSVYPNNVSALSEAAYYAVFHAVSSFCNAGFSLFSNNLLNYRTDILVNFTIMFSVFVGGLGFWVWKDLQQHFIQGHTVQLRLQSIIALKASAVLIVGATFIYFSLERNYSLRGLGLWDQLLSSLFVSINLRTAGFNTTDMGATSEAARIFSCIIMYIGASPGSTGGGIKTTTFAVILATVRQMVNRQHDVIISGRRVSGELVVQAWFLLINSFMWLSFVIIVLCVVEQQPLSVVMYEVFSAYATVGLSTGLTPNLTSFSKVLIAVTMIVGRVGPSTLILAFASGMGRRQKLSVAPAEDIAIG